MLVLPGALCEPAIADDDAVWNADQFHIGKFDARARLFVTVIKQNFKAGGREVGVELVGRFAHRFVLVLHRYQCDLEGGQRVRPENAALVVVLLDGGGNYAGDAYAVAAHRQHDRFAVFAHDAAVHGLAVLGSELEDMPYLDTALDHQRALTVRARVTRHHVAQVGDFRQRQVALPVEAEVMLAVFVGTGSKIADQRNRAIDHAGNRQFQRAQRAGTGTDYSANLGL